MSHQQQGPSLSPEETQEGCLTLLEAEIGQRAYASPTIPAAMVNGPASNEAHNVSVNGNVWEWWKVFRLTMPVSSPTNKPICVSTIGSSALDCNIALQHDEIKEIHCRIYAQLNSGYDCWILENLSDTVIKYSTDETFNNKFHASDRGETTGYRHLGGGQIALHHLRGLAVGPFTFNLQIPSSKQETKTWFRHHIPCLVSEQMLREQSDGRDLTPADFQTVRRIGRGGYGEVNEVMEKKCGLKLAMKIQVITSRKRQMQVDNEIQNLKTLQSPFIVNLLKHMEFDRDDEAHSWILMPLYNMDLSAALRLPEFTMEMRERVMLQIATGLAYMHERNILHRDLKPGNILIATLSPVQAVLADLGVSAYVSEKRERAGTKRYLAPEYRSSSVATFATDIYALGLTFFEIIDSEATKAAHEVALQDSGFGPPSKKWSVLVHQMTYHLPQDRSRLQQILHAMKHGQDLTPNEESDGRNAHYSALARFKKSSGRPKRGTPEWSASSPSFASQDHSPARTLPYGASIVYLPVTQLEATEGQVSGPLQTLQTVGPSSATAAGDRSAMEPYTSGSAYGDAETQGNPSDTKSLLGGNVKSGAPTTSLAAQRRTMPPRDSSRRRAPAKRYDVLRRVRTGRIAKPKAASGSNHTSDTPRAQLARPWSSRAEQVARSLEKPRPGTR